MNLRHVELELQRISERLAAGPDPFEHAGLYAAQQALCWAAQPEAFASPYATVTGNAEGSECYSEQPRHLPCADSAAE